MGPRTGAAIRSAAAWSAVTRVLSPALPLFTFNPHVILQQDTRGIAFQVFVLTTAQCPQTGDQPCCAEAYGNGDEDNQNIHRRSAFRTTRMEDEDITAAAINGVAKPMTATGIATQL